MSDKRDQVHWPPEANEREMLPLDIPPPPDLEDRVVAALHARRLLTADEPSATRSPGFQAMRASLFAAACVAMVAVGVWIGRTTVHPIPASLTGAESDLYALLLFETPGYDRPVGAEARARYGEYSQWVAEAIRREQFVTGEDLDVEQGWIVVPDEDGARALPATAVDGAAALSGIFFIRARDEQHALALARELPHVRHGGSVVVQKTIPTDVPPPAGSSPD